MAPASFSVSAKAPRTDLKGPSWLVFPVSVPASLTTSPSRHARSLPLGLGARCLLGLGHSAGIRVVCYPFRSLLAGRYLTSTGYSSLTSPSKECIFSPCFLSLFTIAFILYLFDYCLLSNH